MLNRFANLVAQEILRISDANWTDHLDEAGQIDVNEDQLFQDAYFAVVPEQFQERFHDHLYEHPGIVAALEEAKILVHDAATSYHNGMREYYGRYYD